MKKIVLTSILGMASCFWLFAQQSKIDSLQKILPSIKSDKEKLLVVNELVKSYFFNSTLDTVKAKEFLIQLKGLSIKLNDNQSKAFVQLREANLERQRKNNDVALQLLNECKAFCEMENLPREKVEAIIMMGDIMQKKNKHSEAIAAYTLALPEAIQLKDVSLVMSASKGLGLSYYNLTSLDSSIKYYSMLKDYALAANHAPYGGNACSMLAIMFQQRGDYTTGIELNKTAIEQYEKAGNKAQVANVMNNLANAYRFTGKFEDALQQYYKATNIREDLKDSSQLASSIFNIADILKVLRQDKRAREYYHRSLDISIKLGDKKQQAISYGGIADFLRDKNQLDSALYYHKKALEIFTAINDRPSIPQAHISIGQMYVKQKKYSEALTHFNIAKPMLEKEGFMQGLAMLYNEMGHLYAAQDLLDYALKNYQIAYDIADSIGYLEGKRDFNINLRNTFQLLGNYSKALQQAEVAAIIEDSMFRTERSRSMQELVEKYETEKKEQQIVVLQKENELKTASELQSNQIRNFSFAGIIALIAFGGFTYNRYRQRKQLSEKLEKSLTELKQTQKQLIEIERLREQEKVRQRISRDLHDDIGSTLSSINMLAHSAKKRMKEKDEIRLHESLEKIGERTQSTLDNMSDIIWSIKPENDSLENVLSHMRDYASTVLEAKKINYTINFPEDSENILLQLDLKNSLYLVFKEAVNNLAKHSHSTQANIELLIIDKKIRMIIEDNGDGFDSYGSNSLAGNGLLNMKRRAEESGAAFHVITGRGKGTRIEFRKNI